MAYKPFLLSVTYIDETDRILCVVEHRGDAGEVILIRSYELPSVQTLIQIKNKVLNANTALNAIVKPAKITTLEALIGQEIT